MKAFQIVFRSGTAVTLYGEDRTEALDSIVTGAEVDCVIDIALMAKHEKEFKSEHEELLLSLGLLNAMQELELKKRAYKHANEKGLIPRQPGQSGLMMP